MTELATTECVMSEQDARRLTEKIRLTAHSYAEAREKLIGYVEQAKAGSAHVALGYRSWTEYLSEVLGEEPMRLARDERREVVALLSSEGMSTRAIAPIVGAGHVTVSRDIKEVVSSETTETSPDIDLSTVDTETGEIRDGPADEVSTTEPTPAPKPITGLDGGAYSRREPTKPRRRPITDQARDAGWDLRKIVERLQRISADDRFAANKEQVTAHLRGHLLFTVEVCQDLIDQITQEGA